MKLILACSAFLFWNLITANPVVRVTIDLDPANTSPAIQTNHFIDERNRVGCPAFKGMHEACCSDCTCTNGVIGCGNATFNGKSCATDPNGTLKACNCYTSKAKNLCPLANNVPEDAAIMEEIEHPDLPLSINSKPPTPMKEIQHLDLTLSIQSESLVKAENTEGPDTSPNVHTDLFKSQPVFCVMAYRTACCPYCTCVNGVIDCGGAKYAGNSCEAPSGSRNGCRCGNDQMNGLCKREDKFLELMLQAEDL